MKVTLKAARVNANLSQVKAAKALGISESTLAKWENGDTCPRADRMQDICDLYNCGMDDVVFFAQQLR